MESVDELLKNICRTIITLEGWCTSGKSRLILIFNVARESSI